MKLSVIQEDKLNSHRSHTLSTKSDKGVFSMKGTLHSVVTCICGFEGKPEKRGERRVGDLGRRYNKNKFNFYLTYTEELTMRFIKSKHIITQAMHTAF